MKKLVAIGESIIDFIPSSSAKSIKDVESFIPNVGGAPANVCAAFSKLGGESIMLTKLGDDPFADKIEMEFKKHKIDTNYILRTKEASTALAFISLDEHGDREFSFYRNPSADMLYSPEEVPLGVLRDAYALHFCSVSLGDFPMKEAHRKAVKEAYENSVIVSFDPNIRKPLWDDLDFLKKSIHEFLKYTTILKVSDDEVEFIFGDSNIKNSLNHLFDLGIKIVIVTKGSQGAELYTKNIELSLKGKRVEVVDTTGAGDSFIGSFLFQLAKDNLLYHDLDTIKYEKFSEYLEFSILYSSQSVKRKGAIESYPTYEEMMKIKNK